MQANEFLYQCHQAALATLDAGGVPYASLVNVAASNDGKVLMQTSALAAHSRNMTANPVVSLVLVENQQQDWQACPRLTLQGRVEPVSAEQAERYLCLFPEAQEYLQLDFSFLHLQIEKATWIQGFGKACSLSAGDFPGLPWDYQREASMVGHMNEDHADAIAHYLHLLGEQPDGSEKLVAIDTNGCWIRCNSGLLRCPFPETANDATAVREQLVALARTPLAD